MFGRDNSNDQDQATEENGQSLSDAVSIDDGPQEELTLPTVSTPPSDSGYMTAIPLPSDQPTAPVAAPVTAAEPEPTTDTPAVAEWPEPSEDSIAPEPTQANDTELSAESTSESTNDSSNETPAEPVPDAELSHDTALTDTTSASTTDLSALKQQALQELSPLLHKLDQSPEEKYKVAVMVYEETKDQNMLSVIYEAAKNLPDEAAKAEAIYDIVKKINEIS